MNSARRRRLTIASVAGFAKVICCVACGLGAACSTERGVSVSVLVDMSSSVKAETQQFYVTAIGDNILSGLDAKDALEVRPIDSSSEQRSEALYSVDLTRQNFARKGDGFAKAPEKVAARVREFIASERTKLEEALRVAAERRRAFSNQTDIIGALNGLGARTGDDQQRPRVIVLFSDMIQESLELDLRRYADEHEDEAARKVDKFQKLGRLPALKGATVVVVGAGEGETASAVAFRAVRTFWLEFFGRAGATLTEGDYGYRTQTRIPDVMARLRH